MRSKEPSPLAATDTPLPGVPPEANTLFGTDTGLVVRGRVMYRTRREAMSKEGTKRFLISLAVMAPRGVYTVDRWSDIANPTDIPAVGASVEFPVRLSANVQAGIPKIRYTYDDGQMAGVF